MPVILNVCLGVPQMLSNIQMILICVAVRKTPFLHSFMTLAHVPYRYADRCTAGAQHVLRTSRKRSAQPPATQRAHGPPRELPFVTARVRLPWRPRVALCHVHVRRPPSVVVTRPAANDSRMLHAGHSGISRSTGFPSRR